MIISAECEDLLCPFLKSTPFALRRVHMDQDTIEVNRKFDQAWNGTNQSLVAVYSRKNTPIANTNENRRRKSVSLRHFLSWQNRSEETRQFLPNLQACRAQKWFISPSERKEVLGRRCGIANNYRLVQQRLFGFRSTSEIETGSDWCRYGPWIRFWWNTKHLRNKSIARKTRNFIGPFASKGIGFALYILLCGQWYNTVYIGEGIAQLPYSFGQR